MLAANKTDWNNAADLPEMPAHLSLAGASRDNDRGYADETIVARLHVSNCRQLGVRMGFARNQMVIHSEGRDASQEHSTDLNRVLRAIETLPKGQRDVMVLVTIQELSHREAAKALNLPIGTVMSRLARGRDRIRMILDVTGRT